MSMFRPIPVAVLHAPPSDPGGSHATVIASGPDEIDWHWHLSITHIERDGDFLALADTRRQLVTLDASIQWRIDDGHEQPLLRLRAIHLDSGDALHISLPEGHTRVFELLLRGSTQGELIARPLNGLMWLPLRPGHRWFVHLLSGQANLQARHEQSLSESLELSLGHSVWVHAQPGQRVHIEGGGELLLVQLAD
ncbi:MAG: HutD family protein [Rhodanobacter sp.]